jgi:hypothetical protein
VRSGHPHGHKDEHDDQWVFPRDTDHGSHTGMS